MELYDLQLRGGRHFLHEHPWGASSWHESVVEDFRAKWQPIVVKGNGCSHGMTTPDSDGRELVAKPTGWMTDSKAVANCVGVTCSNLDGDVKIFEVSNYGRRTFFVPDGARAPRWELITRRVTKDLFTGEVLQDLRHFQKADNE